MIQVSNPKELIPAYSRWLQINESKYWALASQPKPFVQVHVLPSKGLKFFRKNKMDYYQIPTSISYPTTKLDAGVVLTKNTWEVLARNLKPDLQEFLIKYLKDLYPKANISKGPKYDSNDIYINGKKVFGELSFTRAGQVYYACMINMELTEGDKEAIVRGLSNDKNFYTGKIHHITGIKNELENFNGDMMLEVIEQYLFDLSKTPEYICY